MTIKKWFLGPVVALSLFIGASAHADTPGALPQEDVLSYLEQLIQWQRNAVSIEPSSTSAREKIFQSTLQQNALKAMRSGFKFAQQQAVISQPTVDEPASEAEETPRQRMNKRAAQVEQEIDALQAQIKTAKLTPAQRHTAESKLKLAYAKQELMKTVLANMTSASSGSARDLSVKINGLAREIPELAADSSKPSVNEKATVEAAPSAAPATRPSTSIFSLTGGVFETIRKQRELNDFLAQTTQLVTNGRSLLKGLRSSLDALTGEDTTAMPIDAQVAAYKQIGVQIMPLGDSTLWVNATVTTLADWQNTLDQRLESLLRQLAIQSAVLAFTLIIPLVLSEIARRAIKRYIPDPKRKRQANTARRIIVGVAIVFILLLNFISDFSSFATFAGFMTAGLAVALQGVLLSLVAHFFFYGRYGVRPGDRVKVANVVGDIVQIGMMRFYLRELEKAEDGTFVPTGRIVAFPNSILFQPSAFYKYLSEVP